MLNAVPLPLAPANKDKPRRRFSVCVVSFHVPLEMAGTDDPGTCPTIRNYAKNDICLRSDLDSLRDNLSTWSMLMHKTVQIMLRLLGLVATTQAMLQPAAGQTDGETTSSPNQTRETIDYAHAQPMPLPSANTKPPLDARAGPTQRERFGPAGSSPGNPGNGTGGPGPQH